MHVMCVQLKISSLLCDGNLFNQAILILYFVRMGYKSNWVLPVLITGGLNVEGESDSWDFGVGM